MTKEAYWKNFTTMGWPSGYNELIKPPDYDGAMDFGEEKGE